jgi:ribosomal RNA assembly protein
MKDFIRIPQKRIDILKKYGNLKKRIEELTKTKIELNEEVTIEGDSVDVFQVKNLIKAFGRGFDLDDCFNLLEDDFGLEIIDLTEFTKSSERLKTLKGRIIGTKGKTKGYIEKYTDVKISIFGKTVSIIGKWGNIYIAKEAIMKLIRGCNHQTLYRWLEKKGMK